MHQVLEMPMEDLLTTVSYTHLKDSFRYKPWKWPIYAKAGPKEFLGLIKNAEMVVTLSLIHILDIEKRRGITVRASTTSIIWNGCLLYTSAGTDGKRKVRQGGHLRASCFLRGGEVTGQLQVQPPALRCV